MQKEKACAEAEEQLASLQKRTEELIRASVRPRACSFAYCTDSHGAKKKVAKDQNTEERLKLLEKEKAIADKRVQDLQVTTLYPLAYLSSIPLSLSLLS